MLFHATPNIDRAARNQLLLHYFLAGLTVLLSKQLCATADITTVDKAMAIDSELQEPAKELCLAAVAPVANDQHFSSLQSEYRNLQMAKFVLDNHNQLLSNVFIAIS